jgi:hypothetical protein
VYDAYQISEATTNGAQRALYGPGGLSDVRLLQRGALALNDTLLAGIAQVQEAMLMGFSADAFGDVVYSHALGEANPPVDKQLAVYDSVQALLSRAIVNIAASSPTNIGPRESDLVYGGNRTKWIKLAHTLKARFYMHTAEFPARSASAYASAATEASQGILDSLSDYGAIYSGAPGEQNPWSVVTHLPARVIFVVNQTFADTLKGRNDPRLTQYLDVDPSTNEVFGLSATRDGATFAQPIATTAENLLIWSEAAYRTSDELTALARLNDERALYGIAPVVLAGNALLREILMQKYIVDFQLGLEGWKDYRRTCFPNLPNRSFDGTTPMPGRFYYDVAERQTNTNMPAPGVDPNGTRNQVDPVNATADAVGGACLAGA